MTRISVDGHGCLRPTNQQLKVTMKNLIRFLSVTVLLATTVVAQAQVYVEASVNGLTAKESEPGIKYQAKPSTFSGLAGYQINPYLAIEGYLGLGAGKATMTENGVNYGEKFKIDSSYGVFVKPRVAISNDMELFARLGYLESKFSDSNIYNTIPKTKQGSVAFGVGANYYFDHRTYLTGSYMSHHSKDGFTVTGVSIGVGYKF